SGNTGESGLQDWTSAKGACRERAAPSRLRVFFVTPNEESVHIEKMWRKYWEFVNKANYAWRIAIDSWPRDTRAAVHAQSLRHAYQRRAMSAQRRQIARTTP